MDDRQAKQLGEWLGKALVALVVFVFKLVIYWPITILYRQYEKWRTTAYDRQIEAEWQQREATRRGRNTLYDGPQQPNT